jgi:hypothetical protein
MPTAARPLPATATDREITVLVVNDAATPRWRGCTWFSHLLAENPEYLGLSDVPAGRQQLWGDFLLGGDSTEEVVRRGDWAIGDDDFHRRVLAAQGRPAPLATQGGRGRSDNNATRYS